MNTLATLATGLTFWGTGSVDTPVTAVAVAPDGHMFSWWPSEDASGAWAGREKELAPDCNWWNGTYYYAPEMCNQFAVSRAATNSVQLAIERATRCAVHATTECVLNGEIGYSLPSAFVHDASDGMVMMIAPRLYAVEGAVTKTVRLQDPEGVHPNQLFEFNDTVRVEYVRGGTRSLETRELRGGDAYCLQALRRATVPTCWQSLD
jgi:hypothetical protein